MLKKFICASSQCRLPVASEHGQIIVHGAHAHNLKGVCFKFPKNKLVALTGLSGSGKSSIAIDVLGNESVRQLLSGYGLVTDHIKKANVDTILGLSPAITISQQVTDVNPRSLVGTKTGILTILRNLFATIGYQICNKCGENVKPPLLGKHKLITVEVAETGDSSSGKKKKRSFFECPHCSNQLEKLQMSHFSFNTASGICKICKGMGENVEVDSARLLCEEKSIIDGGVKIWDESTAKYYAGIIGAASNYYNFSFDATLPINSLASEAREFLMYGISYPDFVKRHKGVKPPKKVSEGKFEGIVPYIIARYKSNPEKAPDDVKEFIIRTLCCECKGAKLGKLGREATIGGKTIIEVANLSLSKFFEWLESLEHILSKEEVIIFDSFSTGLMERASSLVEVGLHYLSLDRSLPSLSAGEAQRLRLAAALGSSSLTGVLYILDEPTTGLHPYNTENLLRAIRKILKNDNTVLLIEHDLDVVKHADYIIDVGPGRGTKGGQIVATGTPTEIMKYPQSVTGQHLAKKSIIKFDSPQLGDGSAITIYGAREHNLQNINVSIPTGQFVIVTGVSGSGKSTLVFDILDKVMRNHLNGATDKPGKHDSVKGLDAVNRIVTVNQSTIGGTKSSRSIVATYTKLFDLIRNIFASLPESKKNGYTANTFSFNASDKRCENCSGAGVVQVDMSFMPGVEMICPSCEGMRFDDDVLAVKFKGYHISNILDMTVNEAIEFFKDKKKIIDILQVMKRVGLEHLTLGQSTVTLSGGEAQRIKLASELSKTGKEKTLYLLDEPTTGLHPEEVEKLLNILKELVAKGNTVVAIEHNIDAMCSADTLIDFGPGGGIAGGKIIAQGTPQEVIKNKESLTGKCLREKL